ncbi:TPA: MGMT family protein [Candidatus Woesearchaeota archaeon]|nr:MGMT family protein [Candidatus Woesearchaeota archaeon]
MAFNEKIWELCKKIPRGRVMTYKLLAEAAGTKAYRAVGNAMNKNPNGLLVCGYGKDMVPCHRVVDSSGHLRGFAHGLNAKARLLRMEGIGIKEDRVVNFKMVTYRFTRKLRKK